MSKMYFERPDNMAQALSALTSSKAKALAGGTNIMVDIKKGRETGSHFVSLDALDELKKIEDKADGIHVGSLVTFTMLEEAMAGYPKAYKALLQAGASVGGPQIRNRGTIGGNILCASPSSDSMPALLVLDASLELIRLESQGNVQKRYIPLEGFVTGVRKTGLLDNELLTQIVLPIKKGNSCFYKAGTRNAMAISVVNGALYVEVSDKGIIERAAAAFGSVAPVVVRTPKVEAQLKGMAAHDVFRDDFMDELKNILAEEITPISDLRGTDAYRQMVAGNILEENLKTLLEGWR